MNKRSLALAAALLAAAAPAHAQLSNMLSGAMGSASGGGGSGLGSLGGMAGVPSVGAASPTNLAGLLQYCVQNNYLGGASDSGSAPASVQQSLLSKFTGSATPPADDSGYSAGANGDLSTGNGQVALGGTGLKAQLTQRVCAQVLSHAKSML